MIESRSHAVGLGLSFKAFAVVRQVATNGAHFGDNNLCRHFVVAKPGCDNQRDIQGGGEAQLDRKRRG
jgi:hypothetical protein